MSGGTTNVQYNIAPPQQFGMSGMQGMGGFFSNMMRGAMMGMGSAMAFGMMGNCMQSPFPRW